MESFKEKAIEVYRELAQLPVIAAARIFPQNEEDIYEVEIKWGQKDIDRGKKVAFAKSYTILNSGEEIRLLTNSSFQRDATTVCKESYSSNGKLRAVLLKDKSSGEEQCADSHQYIEIWDSNQLIKSINIKEQFKKKHGKIHEDDDQFSSFQLSYDGTKLLYIAEKKRPEAVSYFKKVTNGDKDNDEKDMEQGAENIFQESWGEQLSTVINPVVIVLDILSEECVVVEPEGRDVSLGKARWLPGSNKELVFVGYENNPRKLGFVYCQNRPSTLFSADIENNICTALTDNNKHICSPRFNPQGTKLVFLERDAALGSPHHSCAILKMVDWKSKKITTVIDIVSTPKANGFTGIYTLSFPDRCWNSSGEKLYFSDTQKSLVQIVCVDIITCQVKYLTSGLTEGSYVVLDVNEDIMVFRYASPSQSPIIYANKLSPTMEEMKKSSFCSLVTSNFSCVDKVKWRLIDLSREQDSQPYQVIFISPVKPPSSSLPPLIVWPHGGPHGVYPAEFVVWWECLALLGFAIVLVNYHGSTGFGQDFIETLPGKVGTLDVQDVQFAAESIVKSGEVDKDHVMVMGGSHGGFLTTHMIGQFPDFYKAGFTRNPVIDIAAMKSTTDIPDWCSCEGGISYAPAIPPTSEDYSAMLKCSPIVHASKIMAPLVISLGGEDLRVPAINQGRQLYFNLKAQGKDVSLYYYPKDCHPMMSVDTDADCFMHCVLHFHKY